MGGRDPVSVLLLPGMDGTGALLADLAGRLAARRPVQVIGYPTDRMLDYAALTERVLGQAPASPFVIVGESFSSPIAIEVAAGDPRAVGLVIASGFARHPTPLALAPLARIFHPRLAPRKLIVATLLGPKATPELQAALVEVLAGVPHRLLRARLAEVLRVDKRARLQATACPVLCLHGRADRLVGKRYVNEIVAARPDTNVRWFDAPHMLLETHAAEAAEAIEGFCRSFDESA